MTTTTTTATAPDFGRFAMEPAHAAAGAGLTGLAGAILAAEHAQRRAIDNAYARGLGDDAVFRDPVVVRAVAECGRLLDQIPTVARTFDDVAARAAALLVEADDWYTREPTSAPDVLCFELLKAVLEFARAR